MGVLLFKGGVGVGMLKWQTSVLPRVRGRLGGGHVEKPTQRHLPPVLGIYGKRTDAPEWVEFSLHEEYLPTAS
jgi:hypothetical protein